MGWVMDWCEYTPLDMEYGVIKNIEYSKKKLVGTKEA